jgi:hypothetical protein
MNHIVINSEVLTVTLASKSMFQKHDEEYDNLKAHKLSHIPYGDFEGVGARSTLENPPHQECRHIIACKKHVLLGDGVNRERLIKSFQISLCNL